MATGTMQIQRTFTLVLNEDEAAYLNARMQNFEAQHAQDIELTEHSQIRATLFDLTNPARYTEGG